MIESTDKLFIIGDMLELGNETEKEHQAIAALCESHQLKGYTVGACFMHTDSTAFINQFANLEEASDYFAAHPFAGNTILLKGSRGIGL